MSSHALSAMPPRSALLRLSPFVLAIGALLLPAQARASCTTSGNVTTCTSSGGITVSSTVGASEGSTVIGHGLPGTVTAISVTLTNLNITAARIRFKQRGDGARASQRLGFDAFGLSLGYLRVWNAADGEQHFYAGRYRRERVRTTTTA